MVNYKEFEESIGKYTMERVNFDNYGIALDVHKDSGNRRKILISKHARKFLKKTNVDIEKLIDGVVNLMHSLNLVMVWILRRDNDICIEIMTKVNTYLASANSPHARMKLARKDD